MNNIVHYSLFCQVLKQERDGECFLGKKDLLENDTEGEYGMKDETTELLSKLGSLITKESKSFSREGTDLRTHSGEKQFICKDCSKSFQGSIIFRSNSELIQETSRLLVKNVLSHFHNLLFLQGT